MQRLLVLFLLVLVVVNARELRPHEDKNHPFYEHGIHADFFNDIVVAGADIARLVAHGPKRVMKAHEQLFKDDKQ